LSYIGVKFFQAISAPVFCQSLFLRHSMLSPKIPVRCKKFSTPFFVKQTFATFPDFFPDERLRMRASAFL